MAFIDAAYFINDITLPNLDDENVLAELTNAINKYEREVLRDLLGYSLHKDLLANPGDARWLAFINGAEFSFYFRDHLVETKWEGLVNSQKESLLAYYVYYKVMEQALSRVAGVGGVVVAEVDNSERASATRKMLNAYHKFRKLYGETPYGFNKYGTSYYCYTDEASAYNFLRTQPDVYSGWNFTPKENLNWAGI